MVFRALADPSRRLLLDRLHDSNGLTLTSLCRDLDMSRQAVTKHLGILQEAKLVVPLWKGREKLHYLNPAPLKQIYEGWISKHEANLWRALDDLERGLAELES